MAHQVHWTKKLLDDFIEEALLSDDEIFIMKSRIQGMPVSRQAMELNRSESSIHQMISKLKRKYDIVQQHNPDKFPKRKMSKEEQYMDTH
ncbi:MAG: hypothetical protein MJ235_07720 [archaeon]|nr:hypothetical protein [archaeon]